MWGKILTIYGKKKGKVQNRTKPIHIKKGRHTHLYLLICNKITFGRLPKEQMEQVPKKYLKKYLKTVYFSLFCCTPLSAGPYECPAV